MALLTLGYLIVTVLSSPQGNRVAKFDRSEFVSVGTLTTTDRPSDPEDMQNKNSSTGVKSSSGDISVNSAEVYLDNLYNDARSSDTVAKVRTTPNPSGSSRRRVTKKMSKVGKKKPSRKKIKASSSSSPVSLTSFENKLPFNSKETKESVSQEYDEDEDNEEEDDDDDAGEDDGDYDFFYEDLEELATPALMAFTKRPPPPYKLEDDQYEDDFYADDIMNYSSEKDDGDGGMSFASFFMDLFYDILARFNGGSSAEDDDEYYYDENNYAARRTTPRGYAYRRKGKRGKRPSYNQFLGFYEEDDTVNRIETGDKDAQVESKWLGWFDEAVSDRAVESSTTPMVVTTTESSWGLFNLWNDETPARTIPTGTTSKPATTTTTPNIPALISALSERFVSAPPTTTAMPSPSVETPLSQPHTQKSYKNYQLWRLKPINQEHLNALHGVRLYHTEYQFWQGPTLEGKTDLLVPPHKVDELRELLDEEEIKHTTTIRNLDMAIRYSNPQVPRSEAFQLEAIQGHPMTWHRYHRYADIMKYFEYLHRKYPRNVELLHIGRSFEGRPIVVVHIYERPAKGAKRKKQSIFVESGLRGHEWIGPAVATWILEDLSRNNFRLTNRTLDGVLLSREW